MIRAGRSNVRDWVAWKKPLQCGFHVNQWISTKSQRLLLKKTPHEGGVGCATKDVDELKQNVYEVLPTSETMDGFHTKLGWCSNKGSYIHRAGFLIMKFVHGWCDNDTPDFSCTPVNPKHPYCNWKHVMGIPQDK